MNLFHYAVQKGTKISNSRMVESSLQISTKPSHFIALGLSELSTIPKCNYF